MSKHQLKKIFKTKISTYWYLHFSSLCPNYSSLKFFNFRKISPNKPHPLVFNSGTSDYVNMKTSTILKLLCGRYRLNKLKNKFNNNHSPLCKMCSMNVLKDIPHFLVICPYLDGARQYSLLLWRHQISLTVYNMVHSIFLKWTVIQVTSFILDPMSLFNDADISPHNNLKNDLFKFAQDFTYSLHRQRQLYYGEWTKSSKLQTTNGDT